MKRECFMRKVLYSIFIIAILAICYIFLNFLFFDKWTCYSSEQQINSYIEGQDDKKLDDITDDNKTYQFLKNTKKITIQAKSDNQGSGDNGYYLVDVNHNPAKLYISIKHNFFPEKPKVQKLKLDE